jgi:lipid A 3-O-deacylase
MRHPIRSLSRTVAHAFAVALLVSVAAPSLLPAQAQRWSGWSFYWENDTSTPFGSSDDAFTNGLRLVFGRGSASNLKLTDWLVENLPAVPFGSEGSSAIVVGQNMFTPIEITDYAPDPADRPYAGLAYLGAHWDVTELYHPEESFEARMQQSLEVDLGVLGSAAGGHPIQSSFHSTMTTHRLPKGWHEQLGFRPALSAFYEMRLKLGWDFFDVVPHAGFLVGTMQNYPLAGLTARVGWNLSSFPTPLGRNTAAPTLGRPGWEIAAQVGVEGRYMLSNVFVTGMSPDRTVALDHERAVGDYRLGVSARVNDWRASWIYLVRRSPEVKGSGPSGGRYDNFGSFAIGFEPGGNNDEVLFEDFFTETIPKIFDGFNLEAGAGADLRAADDEPQAVSHSHGMHLAIGRRLFRDFDALLAIDGVGREFGPAALPGGDHYDRLLVNKGLAIRYRIPVQLKGQAHVRAGWSKSSMEYEATPALPGPRACPAGTSPQVGGEPGDLMEKTFCVARESGSGPLLGVGYTYQGWPFTDAFGMNLDLSWNRSDTDKRRDSLGLTGGIRWTPN